MGRWFEKLFRQAGMNIVISDTQETPLSQELIASCDIVVLAVPITAVEPVMKAMGPFIKQDALLMDISSVKKKPIDLMLKYSQSEVIGSHPLFGPSADSLSGQLFFICPSRAKRWLNPLKNFLKGCGAELVEIDPDQHDRLMACFQTLRHMMLTALGRSLFRMGYYSQSETRLAGVWFNQLLAILERQALQPADLYADIAIENPYSVETLMVFQDIMGSLIDSVKIRDRNALIENMVEAGRCCQPRPLREQPLEMRDSKGYSDGHGSQQEQD